MQELNSPSLHQHVLTKQRRVVELMEVALLARKSSSTNPQPYCTVQLRVCTVLYEGGGPSSDDLVCETALNASPVILEDSL